MVCDKNEANEAILKIYNLVASPYLTTLLPKQNARNSIHVIIMPYLIIIFVQSEAPCFFTLILNLIVITIFVIVWLSTNFN